MTENAARFRNSSLPGRVGGILFADGPIQTEPAEQVTIAIENTSEWPVVITSHFHLFEANRKLRFDRGQAFGMHLDIPAGASARIDPGQIIDVVVVPYRGDRAIFGFNGLTNAVLPTDADQLKQIKAEAVARLRAAGYLDSTDPGGATHHG